MKKIICILLLLCIPIITSGSWNNNHIIAAQFLAEKGVIVDRGENYGEYNLSLSITRREMLKVMMNISGDENVDVCEGKFSDMNEADWGCKYAEAALGKGYIAANDFFRPDDSVTQIEALKMIMQAKSIERDESEDWRAGYVTKAVEEGIFEEAFLDYNTTSVRGWIFVVATKTYPDALEFDKSESFLPITPEEEELLNHFLNI